MTSTAPAMTPGVYEISEEDYHRDPVPGRSLSSSGARKLLPPSCPALFRHELFNPPTPSKEFDLGHAAHRLVLGAGQDFVVVNKPDWKSSAARAARKEAHEAGCVPLLAHEHAQVRAMADALRRHPVAAGLFAPGRGLPEQTLIWQDGPSGIWRRARLDWLPHPTPNRMIIADYKTTRSAEPAAIQRAVHSYGYHCQASWYLDGVVELGLADAPAMVFVFQEKEPPYLVTLVELDSMALHVGRSLNRRAINLYRECVETDTWPGYSDEIALVTLPVWAENRFLQEIA